MDKDNDDRSGGQAPGADDLDEAVEPARAALADHCKRLSAQFRAAAALAEDLRRELAVEAAGPWLPKRPAHGAN